MFQRLFSKNIPFINRLFWNKIALNIDEKWGTSKHDYEVLESVMLSINPERILDIGCGSIRFFPLYKEKGVKEVTGQDISLKALLIAKERYGLDGQVCPRVTLTNKDIINLDFPHYYFDLIVSNRVLQHIPYSKIDRVVSKLSLLCKNIYINEISGSDDSGTSFYLFKHDYENLFNKVNFKVAKRGLIGNQTWLLFKKGA